MLGRCLLRLQQYEHLIKAIVAHHEIAGPAHSLESIRAERVADTASKTLGTLVGQLIGSYVVADAADASTDLSAGASDNVISFGMRMQLSLSAEDYARSLGRTQRANHVNESGLYALMRLGTLGRSTH